MAVDFMVKNRQTMTVKYVVKCNCVFLYAVKQSDFKTRTYTPF